MVAIKPQDARKTMYTLQFLMDILQILINLKTMSGLKNILDNIDITILNTELFSVGKEWNYQNASNPYSRIYYITEGYGVIRHHQREYQLLPEHLYLIPCYTTVNMHCPERFKHYYVHFTTRLQSGLDILSIFKCNYQASVHENPFAASLFERLLVLNPDKELIEYDATKPIYKQVLERANHLDLNKSPSNIFETNAIIRILLSIFFKDYTHLQLVETLHGLKRFEIVLDYIHENLNKVITIIRLAEMANLNPTYFSNLFTRLIGISPLQYINKRRVEKAQELLLCTSETLYQIARQTGFSDEYYFSRIFKKTVGISPDHYRKQERMIHLR